MCTDHSEIETKRIRVKPFFTIELGYLSFLFISLLKTAFLGGKEKPRKGVVYVYRSFGNRNQKNQSQTIFYHRIGLFIFSFHFTVENCIFGGERKTKKRRGLCVQIIRKSKPKESESNHFLP